MREPQSVFQFLRRKRRRPVECDGGPYCQASPHLHGCFADKGDCDHPSEHRRG